MGIRRVIVIFPAQLISLPWNSSGPNGDPLSGKIAAHVTLVYPFDNPADSGEVRDAAEKVAARNSRFALDLADPVIVDREYLFLVARQGGLQLSRLHAELYQALPGTRADGPFVPHMTIGRTQDAVKLDAVQRSAFRASLRVHGLASALTIYRIESGGARRVEFVVPLGLPE